MSATQPDHPLPAPCVDAASLAYWQGAKDGVLMIKRCLTCERPHAYPRHLCPFCMGETRWEHASGCGAIYSVTQARRVGPTTYALAYVTLDEGVRMLTHIVDCDFDRLRIGQRVKLRMKAAADGWFIPMFTPSDDEGPGPVSC